MRLIVYESLTLIFGFAAKPVGVAARAPLHSNVMTRYDFTSFLGDV
jgi:hypothetical protein